MGCGTRRTASARDGLVARLHCFSAVGFVGADTAEAGVLGGSFGARCCMCECASACEFSEDGFFVRKEVADQAIGMAFVHCEVGVKSWAEDAGGKIVSKSSDELFIGRGEFDKTSKVGGYGVKGCDVG